MSKRHSKYIASFGYFDKSLIILSEKTGSISIASFATVIGTPVGIASANFNRNCKKTIKKRNKKKKHNKSNMLVRSKLNGIESKTSEALINSSISHQDFITIINTGKKIEI